jgi:hypothetical protein
MITDTIDSDRERMARERTDLDTRGAALDAADVQRTGTQRQEYDAAMQEVDKAEAASVPQGRHVDMPAPVDTSKFFDPKEYESFSSAVIGMSLLGAALSRGNWSGAIAAMNGALKGYMKGNKERADEAVAEYERKFKAAKDEEAQAQKELREALDSRKDTINEKLQKVRVLATKHHYDDIAAEAQRKSIDGLYKALEHREQMLTGVQQRAEAVDKRIATQKDIHAINAGAGGGTKLSPEGEWFVTEMAAGGDTSALRAVSSRFGRGMAVPVFNELGKAAMESGQSPREMSVARINQDAQKAALRQATVRLQGVDRLNSSVQTLERRVVELTSALNGQGIPPVNATINAVKQRMGDGQVQELKTLASSVGRQYVEAITMPGSNAQMHATAQDWATGLLNENMSMSQLQGTLRAMNAEIKATHDALKKQTAEPGAAIKEGGLHVPRPGAPFSDAEKERRYQEWKRTHASPQ